MTDDRLDEIEDRLDGLSDLAIANDGDIEQLQNEIASLRTEISELRADLNEVKDLAELLAPEEDTRKSKEQRAALALATMHRIASNNSTGIHAMDANGVMEANNGEIGRSFAYEVLQAIPDVANDTNVCWFVKESRNSADNTRVVLDLTEGTVPASASGVRIHGGVPADD